MNQSQKYYHENRHNRNIILKARQLGFCLDPKTKVLTAELRWVEIAKLNPGQEIVAVDEYSPGGRGKGRKMKTGIVEKVIMVKRKAFKISFDDGRSVICTDKHPWLTRKVSTDCKWRAIKTGKTAKGYLKVGTQVRWITKLWDNKQSYEDGWFGGMLDGEGSIHKKNTSAGVNVSQRGGEVWERLKQYSIDNGYNTRIEVDNRDAGYQSKLGNKVVYKLCFGRMNELFRLIGKTRPSRFIKNRFWEGRELPGSKTDVGWSKVIKIEELGEQVMVDLQTSTKTYIAEGFVSHNTTYECIDALDDVLFHKNFTAVIIAHDRDAVLKVFKKVKLAWDTFELKDFQMWNANTESANELSFNNGSSVRVALSSRADTVQKLHISEFGKICRKYPQKAKEIITGAFPSVPDHGKISIESTAEGETGEFHDMYWDAFDRGDPTNEKEFKSFFFPWTNESKYQMQAIPDLPIELRKYQLEHNLTDEQIAWYYFTRGVLKDEMKQEYPTVAEEAFESSGVKVFDVEVINELMKKVEQGEKVGGWTYYDRYKEGHRYALGADVAEGIGRDYSTCVVMDFSHRNELGSVTPKIVAKYQNNRIPPDLFAFEIKNGATRFGNCLVAPERNNHGHATLSKLKEIYYNIFSQKTKDKLMERETDKLGWLTTSASKPEIIFNLRTAINERMLVIPDRAILKELKIYDEEDLKRTKYDDEITNHFDLVMALAICYEMRNYASDSGEVEMVTEQFNVNKRMVQ